MKTGLILGSVAAASAVVPPRIELDMSAMEGEGYTLHDLTADGGDSVQRAHDLGYTQPNGDEVLSMQDYTMRCPASDSTTLATCPFPVARAFDHKDERVNVETHVYKVDVNGNTCNAAPEDHPDCGCDNPGDRCEVSSVNFGMRSTYLFKYDATDSAGNRAEQVVFALILDDTTKPTLTMCGEEAVHVEAATEWHLCDGTTAWDNVDGTLPEADSSLMADRISYSIKKVNPASGTTTDVCTLASYANYVTWLNADVADRGPTPCVEANMATWMVGQYVVSFDVCDEAGVYGVNSHNNCEHKEKAIDIRDTQAPAIEMLGANPTYHECGSVYHDDNAVVHDVLDTDYNNVGFPEQYKTDLQVAPYFTVDGVVNSNVVDSYPVVYNAVDAANNAATEVVRNVEIRDTTPPTIALNGLHHDQHYACDVNEDTRCAYHFTCDPSGNGDCPADISDEGVTCTDVCSVDGDLTIETEWVGDDLDITAVGDYVRKYTCTDAELNSVSTERTFTIVDQEAPIIDLMGPEVRTLEASLTEEYLDDGATCSDHVDGVLSHAVEVSGSVVNRRVPGNYTIKYDCQDLSGNVANQVTRTVVVEDDDCPVITMEGDEVVELESGFQWIDPGATATDSLDGDITSRIFKTGDTVMEGHAFYSSRSCRQIKEAVPSSESGNYNISVFVEGEGFERMEVWCDMHSTDGQGDQIGFTYYPCEDCARAVPYGDDEGDCGDMGLDMLQFSDDNAASIAFAQSEWVSTLPVPDAYFPNGVADGEGDADTNFYLCSTNDEAVPLAAWDQTTGAGITEGTAHAPEVVEAGFGRSDLHDAAHNDINQAEAGKYVIHYHVTDLAGNPECDGGSPSRTVIVKDTMRPVISLHLKDQGLIHVSDAGGDDNPAYDMAMAADDLSETNTVANEFPTQNILMAEASKGSVSGWMIAAAASAVTGLALTAYSRKKALPTTPVPV
jgi:hypothetical protein